jgi:hypothetical protein
MARLDAKQLHGVAAFDAYLQTPPPQVVYASSITLDLSTHSDFAIGQLTGPAAISFTNGAPGRRGYVFVSQDGVGGRALSFTAPSGYTLVSDDTGTGGALAPQAASGSPTIYAYACFQAGGTNYFQISRYFQTEVVPSPKTVLGSKLVLELCGEKGITLASGKVSGWADQSGRGNHLVQATTANQPTVLAAAMDGHAGVSCASTGQWLSNIGGFTGLAAGDKPYIYFAYHSLRGSTSRDNSWGLYALTTAGLTATSTDLALNHVAGTGFVVANGATTLALGEYNTNFFNWQEILVAKLDAATMFLQFDGIYDASASVASSSGLAATPTSLIVGRTPTMSVGDFVLMHMLVVNPAPTSAENTAVLAYLKNRYPSLA